MHKPMKKVLIITHLRRVYPRIKGLVKYLPEFGWQPIILTGIMSKYKDLPARIVETPYQNALGFLGHLFKLDTKETDIRQQIKNRFSIISKKSPIDFLLTLGGEVINYPCPDKNWKPFAVKAGSEVLKTEGVDAILSSSMPVISHLIARELKARYKIPWLADLRDLWTQNHNYNYGPLRKLIDRRLELKTLLPADALVVVSEPAAEKLGTLHKEKQVYAITNGFDPVEINSPPANLAAKFTITYTGNIYPKGQEPSKLFAALRDLVSDETMNPDDIEVRFYGRREEWVEREISGYGLSDIVKQNGVVPREIALEKQRESQLLLLLKWEDRHERGIYFGKVFEYLAARRPVLATGGSSDVVDELLNETGAGVCAPTVEDIKSILKRLYQEYKLKGEVAYQGKESSINKYSHKEMARKFAGILDSLAGTCKA